MTKISKIVKTGLIAGLCGLGLCGLEKKYNISSHVADLAHSIEAVPFPGTRIYAFLASKQFRSLYASIAQEIVNGNNFNRILDIGTGPGYLPIEIAKRNPEASISGVDASSDMIQIAEANAHASHVNNSIDFTTGEPTNLPFPGRYFDFVVSVNVLHHWKEPLAVFEEIFHMLVPGGEFWIYDYKHDISDEKWNEIRSKLPSALKIAFMVGPMASAKAAYSSDKLLELASQTRFVNPVLEPRSFTMFGQKIPVFNVLKLQKPALASSDNETG
ncbi:MAG: class I SAM-dependent methyltransferase [Armatimonadota bacterium]